MKTTEAIEICEEWFAYTERQRQKAIRVQELARLAKTDPTEAQRQLRQLDRSVTVYDGDKLLPAVRHLVAAVRKATSANS